MRLLAAFVSALSVLSSSSPALRAHNDAPTGRDSGRDSGRDRKYPAMLPCGPKGECPPGCVCMRLFGTYGVCVVAKPDWDI